MGRETEIAERVVAWLRQEEWEVYEEVQLSQWGRRADIVAAKGRITWVVEVKTSFSFSLLDQGYDWTYGANFVSVAVPKSPKARTASLVLRALGLGLIVADRFSVHSVVRPPMRRLRDSRLIDSLGPHFQNNGRAGNSNQQYYTPFRDTCDQLRAVVAKRPGITMKEAVANISHHYSVDKTAVSALLQWLRRGKIKGVDTERVGRSLRLHPADEPNAT